MVSSAFGTSGNCLPFMRVASLRTPLAALRGGIFLAVSLVILPQASNCAGTPSRAARQIILPERRITPGVDQQARSTLTRTLLATARPTTPRCSADDVVQLLMTEQVRDMSPTRKFSLHSNEQLQLPDSSIVAVSGSVV